MVLERNIKIIHPQFGNLLNDNYADEVQFKLFLADGSFMCGVEAGLVVLQRS